MTLNINELIMLIVINSGTELISGSFPFSSYFEIDNGDILRLREGNHGIILRKKKSHYEM